MIRTDLYEKIVPILVFLDKTENTVVNVSIDVPLGIVGINTSLWKNGDQSVPENRQVSLIKGKYFTTELIPKENQPGTWNVTVTPNYDEYDVIEHTNLQNIPSIGFNYDAENQIFFPPCPVEGYILDTTTGQWNPDPSKSHDLHGDGKLYRYNPENLTWIPVS